MALIDRKTVLASLITAGLAAGAVATPALAADAASVYLVRFAEPGVLAYRGGVGALKPTAPDHRAATAAHSRTRTSFIRELPRCDADGQYSGRPCTGAFLLRQFGVYNASTRGRLRGGALHPAAAAAAFIAAMTAA